MLEFIKSLLISIGSMLLKTFILMDLVVLYDVPFANLFKYQHFLGVFIAYSLLSQTMFTKLDDVSKSVKAEKTPWYLSVAALGIFWGISYVIHWIINLF